MIIDTREYGGVCLCGREHIMTTRSVVIESGCLLRLEEILEQSGIRGKRCAIYGENSYAATADRHPRAGQEIVLPAAGLHADERSTARVLELLDGDVEVILAVGSGTIHDIARYCARERGLRLVSCPTAASVDGFCSTVSAMTWHGYKKTVPAVAPEIVVADTEIIRNAPPELVKSGVGDILAKYTALADWKIANVLTGEYFCPPDIRHDAKSGGHGSGEHRRTAPGRDGSLHQRDLCAGIERDRHADDGKFPARLRGGAPHFPPDRNGADCLDSRFPGTSRGKDGGRKRLSSA